MSDTAKVVPIARGRRRAMPAHGTPETRGSGGASPSSSGSCAPRGAANASTARACWWRWRVR